MSAAIWTVLYALDVLPPGGTRLQRSAHRAQLRQAFEKRAEINKRYQTMAVDALVTAW